MPELPEVETVARQLAPSLQGRRVLGLKILDPLLRHGRTPSVKGRRIERVTRSGKRVLVEFSDSLWLAVHLRMTGRLLWHDGGALPADQRKHLRARFQLDRGQLLFSDTRRFGTFDWYRSEQAAAPGGIDPLSPELTAAKMGALIARSRQNIKAWLLRQDRLVGLGNIYASEILHAAGVGPRRMTDSLDRGEVRRLHRATRRILRQAIVNCGTTFSDFQDARGVEGSYQELLTVYGREAEPCMRCMTPILRIVQQQRSTFYCPACQPG